MGGAVGRGPGVGRAGAVGTGSGVGCAVEEYIPSSMPVQPPMAKDNIIIAKSSTKRLIQLPLPYMHFL